MTGEASNKKMGVKQEEEEVIAWEDENGFCKYCGWCSNYPVCHTEHCVFGWGLGKQTGCKISRVNINFKLCTGRWNGWKSNCTVIIVLPLKNRLNYTLFKGIICIVLYI